MSLAKPFQKFQDWFSQQWVILWGRKINPTEVPWLMGPFGHVNGIGEQFIQQLAAKEKLKINRNVKSKGLLNSIADLNITEQEMDKLSTQVIHFYENTAHYNLFIKVKWNPFFKFFGILVNKLFSGRISQLYIPTKTIKQEQALLSEIITLTDIDTNEIKYTLWLRKVKSSGQIIFSGIYGTCQLPSGITCVKAIFPLPNGNATVILKPEVLTNGALKLNSSGKKFGDAGFYFLLEDSKGRYHAQYIKSFRDSLTIQFSTDKLIAQQKLTLWKKCVLKINYRIERKE